jgi:hypothetical protein
MAARIGRGVGFALIVVGTLVGVLVGGTAGAIAGVLTMMVGFQALTRGVEGAPYITAGIVTTAGLVLVSWRHGLTWTALGLGHTTWVTEIGRAHV